MIRRAGFLVTGWVCVAIGAIGLVTPMLPGVPFLICAAACFTRSSPRFENWLLSHPTLGPPVLDWREYGAISKRIKVFVCVSMIFSLAVMWLVSAPAVAFLIAIPCMAATIAFILSRPSVRHPSFDRD